MEVSPDRRKQMGHTLLQIGRIVMMAFWFAFTLVALNMALDAWANAPSWQTAAFFFVAAYAGLGMLIGMVVRFNHAMEVRRVGY
jgi:hypothetical protein